MVNRTAGVCAATAVLIVAILGSCGLPGTESDTYVLAVVRGNEVEFKQPLATLETVDGHLHIQGFHMNGPHSEQLLSISFSNPRAGGARRMGSTRQGAWSVYFDRDIPTDNLESYGTDETHGGIATVTRFDSKRRIIEGTFEYQGILKVRRGPILHPDTLTVRSGSFRARYHVVRADAYDSKDRD